MRSNEIIREMLEERQELLVAFCRLTGAEPYVVKDGSTVQRLNAFCQTLMDYAGIVHFEVFEKLADEAFAAPSVRNQARRLFDPLVDNTAALVGFNDRYDAARSEFSLHALGDDLSQLGENLAARFELEDTLINLLSEAKQ